MRKFEITYDHPQRGIETRDIEGEELFITESGDLAVVTPDGSAYAVFRGWVSGVEVKDEEAK